MTVVSARRLLGRCSECAALDELVASVRTGASRALVLRGEAGVGKSALLEYLTQHASGCGTARANGVESEMELAYAGLQQLCAPFLDRLEGLPGPHRDALELLETVVAGPLDERVRDRIVAETRGNPLALLELPRRRTLAELAGGFGLSDGVALSGRIEQSFTERLAPLPTPTRLLLLVAATEPVGD